MWINWNKDNPVQGNVLTGKLFIFFIYTGGVGKNKGGVSDEQVRA
jgi:hypothetical protein